VQGDRARALQAYRKGLHVFSKDSRLSARVFGRVLNFPLYDGDCSSAARECLARGDVNGAVAEWQRIAGLGSGTARCILAYLHLMGAPSIPMDLAEARRMALSAVSGARGYANYLLGCISLREKQPSEAAKYFGESIKTGFTPAATHLASIVVHGASEEGKRKAVNLLHKSVSAGHWPAFLILARVYLSGRLGFAKRLLGLVLFLPAFLRFLLALKYQIFSIQTFQVAASGTQSLFSERGVRYSGKTDFAPTSPYRRTVVRCAHAAAGMAAVLILAAQSRHQRDGSSWALTTVGFGLLAAWPYAISYLIASHLNTRTFVSTLVQTILLCLVSALVCSTYTGHLFHYTLSVWNVAEATATQAFLFFIACGLGENAAAQVEIPGLPVSNVRRRLVWGHFILGIAAAGSWLSRPEVWSSHYLRENGLDLVSYALLAILPYLMGAVIAWRNGSLEWWKTWIYIGVLIIGTALAIVNNSGIWVLQPGILGVLLVLFIQFIGFLFAGEWALDDAEGNGCETSNAPNDNCN
jgi:TPR repeat protein